MLAGLLFSTAALSLPKQNQVVVTERLQPTEHKMLTLEEKYLLSAGLEYGLF